MLIRQLFEVFASAAVPQKVVMLTLVIFIAVALFAAWKAFGGGPDARRSRFVSNLGEAGFSLGLMVGALNAFHMMQTTLRLPYAPTSKDLAPGITEIAVLVGLGSLAGLVGATFELALTHRAR